MARTPASKGMDMPPRIGWVINNALFPFILPVLQKMPGDLVETLIPGDEEHTPLARTMRDMGFACRTLDVPSLPAYDMIVLDMGYLLYSDQFDNYPHTTRFLCLQHSTDNHGLSVPRAQYHVRAHKMLAQCCPVHGCCVHRDDNPALCDQLCLLPAHAKEEFAYSGPYHMGPWAEKRHLPKAQLRLEMEETLGRTLPKQKPVVAFFLDEVSHDGQLVEGLRLLSQHCTIIYKTCIPDDPRAKALGDAVIPWTSVAYAPNTLRFGADFILAGYNSGTFVTAVMLGLRVLPFYTRLVYCDGRGSKRLSSYSTLIFKTTYSNFINQNCMLGIGNMYDIQNTEELVRALHDPRVWQNYNAQLPEIQQKSFGDYCIEGAAEKTALLIIKAWHKGTFGEDASAVHLRECHVTV